MVEKIKTKLGARKAIPSFLGVILLLALGIGVILVRRQAVLRGRASGDSSPRGVQIANVTDRSFVVSWLTAQPTKGEVALNLGKEAIFWDSRGDGNFTTHYVIVNRGLEAGQRYTFVIISGGRRYQAAAYQVKLAPPIAGMLPVANLAYGDVRLPGGAPAAGAIVYLNIPGLAPLSSLVSSEGHWVIPLSVAFDAQLAKFNPKLDPATEETIRVIRQVNAATVVRNVVAQNQPVPPIILGQNDDFRQKTTPTPLPTTAAKLLPETGVSPTPAPFKILNPNEGEKINTRQPQIFGQGAAGGRVKIEIHSEKPVVSADIPIGDDQQWSWTIPDNLAPGDHTLTVHYYDPQGNEQTFTRHFTVLAADDGPEPAFTASATATLAPSPTPTIMPTATPGITATASGIPNTGPGSFSVFLLAVIFLTLSFGGYLWLLGNEF